MSDYEFTADHFSHNIPNWKIWFSRCNYNAVNLLEIGSFEGRSTVWFCENALQHPDSAIVCVDPWSAPKTDVNLATDNVIYERFMRNVSRFGKKVKPIIGNSRDVLKNLPHNYFDAVYIDGDHESHGVLEDGVLAFPLVRIGGVMIFDDFCGPTVRCGVESFVSAYSKKVKVVYAVGQLVAEKIAL